MSLLKNINLNGTLLEIADETARTNADNAQDSADTAKSTADSALSKANTAQGTADSALTKANAAQSTADSKALIRYSENEMTMYIN